MWRQGDIFISQVSEMPEESRNRPLPNAILAHGELTGHSHRIENPQTAALFAGDGCLYLHVLAEIARIVHDEHSAIALERGLYRVWRQREYTPQRAVIVQD